MLRPEMSVLSVFHYCSPPYFLKLCLSLNHVNWSHQAPGSSRLWLPSDQIKGTGCGSRLFCGSWGSELTSLRFHGKHFTNWAISPAPREFSTDYEYRVHFPTAYERSLSGRATGRSAVSPKSFLLYVLSLRVHFLCLFLFFGPTRLPSAGKGTLQQKQLDSRKGFCDPVINFSPLIS